MDYRETNLGYKIPKAGMFGEILRIKIIQQDRLDIWPNNYLYYERGRYEPISPVKDGFLKPEDNVSELVQSLYDNFFVNASDKYSDPRGAAIELYGTEVSFKRRFVSKDDLPALKKLLEKYLPTEFIPKFLNEEDKIITKKQWWNYNDFWTEEGKFYDVHLQCKCPVCGNDDFILVKEASDDRVWDIESKMRVYGCTKCYLLLHFCPEAVFDAQYHEEDDKRINDEIESMKNAVYLLRKKRLQLEEKLKEAKTKEEISKIKKQIEMDVDWKIQSFEMEIKTLQEGYEDDERYAEYSRASKRFEYYDETIKELNGRISSLEEQLNKK